MRRWLKWSCLICLICLSLGLALLAAHQNGQPLPRDVRVDRVLIEKAARRLTLYRRDQPLKSYHIALGSSPVGHKQREGDGRTPEGQYRIQARNERSAFYLGLQLSYPSQRDREDAAGRHESPGGAIMLHGLPNGLGWIGSWHRLRDWTAGCVAVADFEMEEIWRSVGVGVSVEIVP
jgi:murein L,D-transpeptidase YafK